MKLKSRNSQKVSGDSTGRVEGGACSQAVHLGVLLSRFTAISFHLYFCSYREQEKSKSMEKTPLLKLIGFTVGLGYPVCEDKFPGP